MMRDDLKGSSSSRIHVSRIMSRRTEMLGSTIQRELAEMIMRDLQDPRLTGLPSITRVKVSPDLSIADVYITVMGTEGQQTAALNALKHSAGMMRAKLTKALTLRQAPFVRFHIDENLKKEIAVLDLIRKANEERAEREGTTEAQEAQESQDQTEEQNPE
jgi:ribosome-binding factor A